MTERASLNTEIAIKTALQAINGLDRAHMPTTVDDVDAPKKQEIFAVTIYEVANCLNARCIGYVRYSCVHLLGDDGVYGKAVYPSRLPGAVVEGYATAADKAFRAAERKSTKTVKVNLPAGTIRRVFYKGVGERPPSPEVYLLGSDGQWHEYDCERRKQKDGGWGVHVLIDGKKVVLR